MGDRLVERAADGRLRVNLRRLPAWAQLSLALAVVASVLLVAREAAPEAPVPDWLWRAIRIAGWCYLALIPLALTRWLRGGRRG
jgi:hypothetical protein